MGHVSGYMWRVWHGMCGMSGGRVSVDPANSCECLFTVMLYYLRCLVVLEHHNIKLMIVGYLCDSEF